jgi:hypothetical protein
MSGVGPLRCVTVDPLELDRSLKWKMSSFGCLFDSFDRRAIENIEDNLVGGKQNRT